MKRTPLKRKTPLRAKRGDKFKTRRRDPEKLAWVKRQGCAVLTRAARLDAVTMCSSITEAHHVAQERNDDECVPLCGTHHYELHNVLGKREFLAHHRLPSWKDLAAEYEARYQREKGT